MSTVASETGTRTPDAEVPSVAELVARARGLRPQLAEALPECERLRRVPESTIEALQTAGFWRLCAPRRFGGYELPLTARCEIYEALGEACASTAWTVMVLNEIAWLTGMYPSEVQEEVFGSNPDARLAGSFSPEASVTAKRVDGGYLVSGRWPWASGCWHSDWAGVSVVRVDENGNPLGPGLGNVGFGLVPMSDLSVEDTWFVAGMRGSGSNTMVGENIFIPDYRMLTFGDLADPRAAAARAGAGVIYRAAFGALPLALTSMFVGQTTRALEYVLDRSGKRGVSYTRYLRQADSTAFQLQVSDAAMKIDTARLHLRRSAREIEEAAERNERLDPLTSARIRGEVGYISSTLRQAIDQLVTAHGAGSFAEVSLLQQIWRDVNVAARHAFMNEAVCREVYGQALVGDDDPIMELV